MAELEFSRANGAPQPGPHNQPFGDEVIGVGEAKKGWRITSNESMQPLREILPTGEVRTYSYFEQTGKLSSRRITLPDGKIEQEHFHEESGKPSSRITKLHSGVVEWQKLDENTGNVTILEKTFPNGEAERQTFDANTGEMTSHKSKQADGTLYQKDFQTGVWHGIPRQAQTAEPAIAANGNEVAKPTGLLGRMRDAYRNNRASRWLRSGAQNVKAQVGEAPIKSYASIPIGKTAAQLLEAEQSAMPDMKRIKEEIQNILSQRETMKDVFNQKSYELSRRINDPVPEIQKELVDKMVARTGQHMARQASLSWFNPVNLLVRKPLAWLSYQWDTDKLRRESSEKNIAKAAKKRKKELGKELDKETKLHQKTQAALLREEKRAIEKQATLWEEKTGIPRIAHARNLDRHDKLHRDHARAVRKHKGNRLMSSGSAITLNTTAAATGVVAAAATGVFAALGAARNEVSSRIRQGYQALRRPAAASNRQSTDSPDGPIL